MIRHFSNQGYSSTSSITHIIPSISLMVAFSHYLSLAYVSRLYLWSYSYCSISSVQLVSHVRLCDPMNRSTPGLPVHHQLPEFTQTHVHGIDDAIQPSHPLFSPSPAPNPSQHHSIFQWVNSSHEVAKVLEFQL